MFLTDYYKAEQLSDRAKTRFDITASTQSHDVLEALLDENKQGFNIGGKRLAYRERPTKWSPKSGQMAITGKGNISTILRPRIDSNASYGDINSTEDAIVIIYNSDYLENRIKTIELFISRGRKADCMSLFNMYQEGELDEDIETLRKRSHVFNIKN